ncbi:MAG: GNAT family N-acetyltransferase [Bryobacterales bacterium]|nr:GNAT family N-acetyltransferase [Bryobacterales bacterium]
MVFIRPARPDDAAVIASFNAAMALETESVVLDPKRVHAGVAALLADPSKGFYTVAETEGTVIGQTMVTYEWSDWRNGVFWWLQSVYVATGWRGRGVFRKLLEHIEIRARAEACGLRLYVERHNQRAARVYETLGFAPTAYNLYEKDFVTLERSGQR